jgi:hypothetical protein
VQGLEGCTANQRWRPPWCGILEQVIRRGGLTGFALCTFTLSNALDGEDCFSGLKNRNACSNSILVLWVFCFFSLK